MFTSTRTKRWEGIKYKDGSLERYSKILDSVAHARNGGGLLADPFRANKKRIVVTRYVQPTMAEKLRELHIQFMDTVGNTFLYGNREAVSNDRNCAVASAPGLTERVYAAIAAGTGRRPRMLWKTRDIPGVESTPGRPAVRLTPIEGEGRCAAYMQRVWL